MLLGAVVLSAAEKDSGLHLELLNNFFSLARPAEHELCFILFKLLVRLIQSLNIALLFPLRVQLRLGLDVIIFEVDVEDLALFLMASRVLDADELRLLDFQT